MITLNKISKKMGARVLFDDVTSTFTQGARYGLTGPNGAGKSTLLKIMMGVEEATSGSVSLPKRVGFLRQNIEEFREAKVIDAVIMGNERLFTALSERDALYEQEMTEEVGMRLGDLEEIIAEEDGYSADSDAEILLSGMLIPTDFFEKKMKEIPTDLQFRVLLCQALFGDPEAILLDEPTNHLDLEAIGWLETFLKSYQGTMIVVSHDRHFLNAVTTHIADIDYDTIITYPGNYDEMLVAKTAVRARTEAENKSKEKKAAQLKEFVQKFSAGTRSSQVQSRLKEIKRLEPQELRKSNIQRPYMRFIPGEEKPGKIVLKVDNISKAFDGVPVIEDFSIEIMRGDKIAVIGNNGRGKTTLLRMLSGTLKPDSGIVEAGHQVHLGYFPQNHADVIDKSSTENLFDYLKGKKSGAYDQDIRSVMGKMLFGGDDAFKEIKVLSGGETARLLFSELMLLEHNVLILDEPNNHLDLESISALSWGLNEFKETVILATHDRDLINDVATKIIAFEEDGIHVYDGAYKEFCAKSR